MPTLKVTKIIDRKKVEHHVPLIEKWREIQAMLEGDSPAVKEHREKLFGSPGDIDTNGIFGEISLCKRDGMPPYHEFKSLPIRERARYIAFASVDSMKEIVERHNKIMKDNMKSQLGKHHGK
jgi:hypothetical protein